jgi:hypothetical protein
MPGDRSLNIFPLPLSMFEKYMMADDHPEYPMTLVVQMAMAGRVDEASLRLAVPQALDRHPLLRAHVERSWRGSLTWSPAEVPRPLIDCQGLDVPITLPCGGRIDLQQEIGLRIWIRQDAQQSKLVMQFHHACTDGIGALQFTGDLMACYDRLMNPRHALKLAPLDIGRLSARGRYRPAVPRIAFAWQCIRWLARNLLAERPSPLPLPTTAGVTLLSRQSFPYTVSSRIDRHSFRRLRQAAQFHRATFNDLLVRDLFLTLKRWNARHMPPCNKHRISVLMPVDLRGKGDTALPAANRLTYVRLSRLPASFSQENADRLLCEIREETQRPALVSQGMKFLAALRCVDCLRIMHRVVTSNECFATVVLTNLGDPTRRFNVSLRRQAGKVLAGNLRIEETTGTAPLRRHTRAAFTVHNYAGELVVSLQADPHYFSGADATELLQLFLEQLQASLPPIAAESRTLQTSLSAGTTEQR